MFVLGPFFVKYDFDAIDVINRAQGPSLEHPFGTDDIGRDILARTLIGGRVSLRIALITSVVATVIGTVLGAVSGYFGGLTDAITNWVINLFLTVPLIAVLLVFGVKYGGSPLSTGLMVAFFGWVGTARVVRSQFVQYKNMEFVQAARAAGASSTRIIFRHILPNTLGPILVAATLLTGTAIILESTLSFLSLGVKPPATSLGVLVAEAKGDVASAPHRILFPGLFITLIVLSINFLGDGLRDALDPTSKGD
jgi:peptide/nickel transport system permease protein